MPEPLVIRTAEVRDISAILSLYRVLDEDMVRLQPEFFCAAPREDSYPRTLIERADADFLLAELDGAPAGFALVTDAGWTPEFSCILPHRYACLNDLVVARALRGQGIGSQLLGAAKRWARARRLEYLEISALAENTGALRLYEAHDFVSANVTLRCML